MLRCLLGLVLFVGIVTGAAADSVETLALDDDIEVDIRRFGSDSAQALIWFACNQGEDSIEFATARKLIARGYQIYFPDMLSAHF